MIYLTALPATRLLRPSSPPSVCGEPRAIRERVGREVRSSPAVRSKQEPALTRANTREQAKKNRPYRRFFNYPGGEGGIRTRGGLLTHTRFPGVRLKPLIHLSEARDYSHACGGILQICRISRKTLVFLEPPCCQPLVSAALRMPCNVPVGVMASGSMKQCRIAGRPLARARSRAGAKSSVRSTRSPWPPKAWA